MPVIYTLIDGNFTSEFSGLFLLSDELNGFGGRCSLIRFSTPLNLVDLVEMINEFPASLRKNLAFLLIDFVKTMIFT